MGFGYIGYVWTILGCSLVGFVVLFATMGLYGWAARSGKRMKAPAVEEVPLPPKRS